MRSDMHKVIVERPRLIHGGLRNKKTALRLTRNQRAQAVDAGEDYDSGPPRASSARHQKGLNENLAPLRRYLMRQAGRPWDKVYSEICRTIDTRSAVGLHVLQHVGDFVATSTFIDGGVVFERWWRSLVRPVTGLYVHPVTGLLRIAKCRQTPTERPRVDTVKVSETMQYQKIDGLWFRMEYRRLDPDDLVRRHDGKLVRAAELGRDGLPELVRKQQCDRKTIRKIEEYATE